VSWLGVVVVAAFSAAADALTVAFLNMAVCLVTETVEPDTRVFDDGRTVGGFATLESGVVAPRKRGYSCIENRPGALRSCSSRSRTRPERTPS
jgi:hypothetical protein